MQRNLDDLTSESKLEFRRSKTKLVLSFASLIWFQNFCPKWPQPNGMKSPMQRNLDDLTSEGLNLSFWGQRPNWCYLWPPSFDFRILAQNGLNLMGWGPPCRETLMIRPLKVLTWVSEVKDQIGVNLGLCHLISEFWPKMASTHWDEVPHAEKPWWFDLWRS